MSKLIDLTGQDFGYWHVIERAENGKDGRARWLCHCTLCDKTTRVVQSSHLRGGRSTSCGCTKMEKMRQASIKNEAGKTYGYLQVERMATSEEKPRDVGGIYWICSCSHCGRKNVIVRGDYLRNGDTISCGCIESKNESLIAQMLDGLGFSYIQQYKFNDLSSTGRECDRLMFDFAIIHPLTKQLLYLIEYDGIQHFHHNTSGWNNEDQQKTTHKNDLLKNKYCFSHNIPLIRIPYDMNYDLQDIKLETTRFLLTPENEQEYYNKRKDNQKIKERCPDGIYGKQS